MLKSSKPKPSQPSKRFRARLERLRSRLNWIIAYVPFDAARVWGLRGQIKVKGEINGFSFRTSLFPTRAGRHFLLINKRMQNGSGSAEGSIARFQLEVDLEKRAAAVSTELKAILAQDRSLRSWYEKLNYSTRDYIAKWIAEPKSEAARLRRTEQIGERLLAVMDAERELPPILQVAFARDPQARDGWDSMSAARRRGHLFGIFYYKNPEAQGRRIDKMLEDANTLAEKKRAKKQ